MKRLVAGDVVVEGCLNFIERICSSLDKNWTLKINGLIYLIFIYHYLPKISRQFGIYTQLKKTLALQHLSGIHPAKPSSFYLIAEPEERKNSSIFYNNLIGKMVAADLARKSECWRLKERLLRRRNCNGQQIIIDSMMYWLWKVSEDPQKEEEVCYGIIKLPNTARKQED